MAGFIHVDFLLQDEPSRILFHRYAEGLPIIDYHCHLDPRTIYENRTFRNLAEAWLAGDHYKWRLMRANGVTEDDITGDKPDFDKFLKWAETVPLLVGNPLYHWTHLELQRYFGIETLLSPTTAKAIYEEANAKLQALPVRTLIARSGVEILCTTDDPADTLEWHAKLAADRSMTFRVLPAFRPDKAVNVELPGFPAYVLRLAQAVARPIASFAAFKTALLDRIEHFHRHGCRLADHALDKVVFRSGDESEVAAIFAKSLSREPLSDAEVATFKAHMMVFFGREYAKRGWVQQYHIGAFRNVASRMAALYGPDTGYDAIQDAPVAEPLRALFDALDVTGELPKTILYTLHPADFEVAIALMQAFQGGGVPGKIQFGSAWWFLDTVDGMERQLRALGNNGLLARFVGMLTDSRSFLSYPRHEYFRRVFCGVLGKEVECGRFPADYALLGGIVKAVCHDNAASYFQF